MIRFVNMNDVGAQTGFAFWDTRTDRFVQDNYGDQAWESVEEFREGMLPIASEGFIERCIGLIPSDWVFTDDEGFWAF